jgi:hypothetical protein
MKKRNWMRIKKDGKLPKENIPVRIFINDGKGFFNVFTAHQEQGVWLIYDPFTDKYRVYTRQQFVTHWKYMDEFPSGVKK